jgi:hypothetical protein
VGAPLAAYIPYTAEGSAPVAGGALQAAIGLMRITGASIDAQRQCGVNKVMFTPAG